MYRNVDDDYWPCCSIDLYKTHKNYQIRLLLRCSEERQPVIFLSISTINVFVFVTDPPPLGISYTFCHLRKRKKYDNPLWYIQTCTPAVLHFWLVTDAGVGGRFSPASTFHPRPNVILMHPAKPKIPCWGISCAGQSIREKMSEVPSFLLRCGLWWLVLRRICLVHGSKSSLAIAIGFLFLQLLKNIMIIQWDRQLFLISCKV
jgi:hypothetical protein